MRFVSQLLTKWFTSALLRMSSRTTSLKPLKQRMSARTTSQMRKNVDWIPVCSYGQGRKNGCGEIHVAALVDKLLNLRRCHFYEKSSCNMTNPTVCMSFSETAFKSKSPLKHMPLHLLHKRTYTPN